MAELLEMTPYELSLEVIAREAFLSESFADARRWQSGTKGPSTGSLRATWRLN